MARAKAVGNEQSTQIGKSKQAPIRLFEEKDSFHQGNADALDIVDVLPILAGSSLTKSATR